MIILSNDIKQNDPDMPKYVYGCILASMESLTENGTEVSFEDFIRGCFGAMGQLSYSIGCNPNDYETIIRLFSEKSIDLYHQLHEEVLNGEKV